MPRRVEPALASACARRALLDDVGAGRTAARRLARERLEARTRARCAELRAPRRRGGASREAPGSGARERARSIRGALPAAADAAASGARAGAGPARARRASIMRCFAPGSTRERAVPARARSLRDAVESRIRTRSTMNSRDVAPQLSSSSSRRGGTASCPARRSCCPHDPTLLFANAGMNQFKDVFTGREKRDYARAVSVAEVPARVGQAQRPRDGRAARRATTPSSRCWATSPSATTSRPRRSPTPGSW